MKRCSQCKEEKPFTEFNKNKCRQDGYQHICKTCKKERGKKIYQDNKQVYLERNCQRRDNWRGFFIDIKKQGCERCEEDHPACIDFHHLDPEQKDFDLSRSSGMAFNEKNIQLVNEEIVKCIRICRNCHTKLHWEEGDFYKNVI